MNYTFPSESKRSSLQKPNPTDFLASASSSDNINDSIGDAEFNSSDSLCKSYISDDEEVQSHISEPDDLDSCGTFTQKKTLYMSQNNQEQPLLNIELSGKTLKIDEETLLKNQKDFPSLKEIKKLEVDFTEFSFGESQIRQLTLIVQQLKNIRKAKFIIRNQKQGSIIQKLLDEIFLKFRDLKGVKFDFYRSKIASECVDYLIKEIIPKLNKNLKSFDMNLYGSDVTNENVQKLAWSLRERFRELEDFRCNLAQTKVTEKVIIQFFHEMPKMKSFELNIGNCVFTDYGMKIFIRNTLKSMRTLEKLTFLLEATDVMSDQIVNLFKDLPETLKKLQLDLRWTRATSDSLRVFTNEKLPKLVDLEEVELKVDCTLASKKMREQIDDVNRKFAKKIDAEKCKEYQQMIKLKD